MQMPSAMCYLWLRVQMTATPRSARSIIFTIREKNRAAGPSPPPNTQLLMNGTKEHDNLLGSEIYCVWEGFTSPTSILVILITLSTTKSFWIICHSLGHMRAILCKKKQQKTKDKNNKHHALRHVEINRANTLQKNRNQQHLLNSSMGKTQLGKQSRREALGRVWGGGDQHIEPEWRKLARGIRTQQCH